MLQKKSFQFLFLFAILAITFISATGFSANNGWRKIGEKQVDYRMDHDVLNASVRDGNFKQIKFVVRGGALNIYKCVVHFQNGENQEINLRNNFKKGSDSRIIDLEGKQRFIDKISFWYDTKNAANQKATMVVWGK